MGSSVGCRCAVTVPDFQTIMRPVLGALEDGKAKPTSDIRAAVAGRFALTQDELEEKVRKSSGLDAYIPVPHAVD